MAFVLPNTVVMATVNNPNKGHVYYKDDGSVLLGETDVFSTTVTIAVETATTNDKYVHLRFSYSNRYWAQNASNTYIAAEATQPEEDITKPTCTLFEPVQVDDNGAFTLTHAYSGGRLLMNTTNWMFYVETNYQDAYGHLTFVDWATLVKLPPHCAFKGDNGQYLKSSVIEEGRNIGGLHLQFGSNDANDVSSGHQVSMMSDGHVHILSDYYNNFWWLSGDWIFGDWNGVDETTRLFWPVKIDDNTIALRSAANNNFCNRLTVDGYPDCLAATVGTITTEARLQVQELVSQRKIYNVVYQMENARIYDETPYLAGTATLTNITDQEDSMSVSIMYQDEKSYTFSRSVSITAGVSVTIEAGVPLIIEETIEISFEINGTFEWDTTTTTTTSVTATGTVPVPARSIVVVDYVGTRGTCNIPYSYTQEDQSSTTGEFSTSKQVDGIYNGVSYYDFQFQVRQDSVQSL